jgi:hypothetical protein
MYYFSALTTNYYNFPVLIREKNASVALYPVLTLQRGHLNTAVGRVQW